MNAQTMIDSQVPKDRSFFGHPVGLRTLFLTELWERFSYYGMRALLILFMTAPTARHGLGIGTPEAGAIYGLYTGMVYLLALPGGWIADKILGGRRAVLIGGVIIALGHFCLAIPTITTFFVGLVLIVTGTGLLKPNVSTMVGQLYPAHDPRRDAGFSIFYIGINLGAFIAPLICSYVGENINWHYGFALAGLGMTVGVVQYTLSASTLGTAGTAPVPSPGERKQFRLSLLAFLFVLLLGGKLAYDGTLSIQSLSSGFGVLLTTIVIVLFAGMLIFGKWTKEERGRLIAIFVLFAASALFWSIYEQGGSTLNLFADRNTNRTVPGMSQPFPAGWFQSLPALFVISIAPMFAWLWVKLGDRNPSSTIKFSIGLLFGGLSFIILIPIAGKLGVSPIWLTLTYLLQTIGELCLSPVGLSAMTKLAPQRIASMIMGVFFVSISIGDYFGGRMASIYETMPLPQLFGTVGVTAVVLGVVLALFNKPMKRLIGSED
jgi:proton-dependent oligopeptide transporter, POT family